MLQWIEKRQKAFLLGGSIFIMIGLIIPLIIYGIVASNSEVLYKETTCYYIGYTILDKNCGLRQNNYTGFLDFKFIIGNIVINRDIDIYCSNIKQEIETYFKKNYNNQTSWPCWYEDSDPHSGWIGFSPPYDANGSMMVIAGIIIFLIYASTVGIYLIIQRNNTNKYYIVQNDLPI